MIGEKSITGAYLLLLRLDEPSELVMDSCPYLRSGDYAYVVQPWAVWSNGWPDTFVRRRSCNGISIIFSRQQFIGRRF